MHPTFRNAGPSGRRFLLTALAWRVCGRVKESVCIAETLLRRRSIRGLGPVGNSRLLSKAGIG